MKILHLYHDFMNLYGDYANTLALKRIIENSGESCEIVKKTLGDSVSFADYAFVYIGSGTERNQKKAMEDFSRLAGAFSEYVDSGKPALLTGNSFEMLGKSVTDSSGVCYEGACILDITTTEQNRSRLTSDVIFEADFLKTPVVGFVNKCSEIKSGEKPLFTVKTGLGNSKDDAAEGVLKNNLFCTHLTGPALIKNPHFLAYTASLVLGRESDDSCFDYERRGYDITLRELSKLNKSN